MRLLELQIDGFGKLDARTFTFEPRLVVVFGPNEAGKSTLAEAIVRTLYGVGRDREAWRPWLGARYSTRLRYALADGREFEIQRDFERDPKGVVVYDRSGADVTAQTANGKNASPGNAHLGIPYEVFVNAACLRQGDARIDGSRAEVIGASLARALDGGPREDAALGALGRLDRALATHVGTKRATVNAPLRKLLERRDETADRASEQRAGLLALAELRTRLDERTARAAHLAGLLRDHEVRARNLNAAALRDRLASLREIRDDTAALSAEREDYDDVASFRRERVAELQSRYERWQTLDSVASAAGAEELEARMTPAQTAELDERRTDGGALDDEAFARLQQTAREALQARDRANHAANAASVARRVVDSGAALLGAATAAGVLLVVAAAVLGFAHLWRYAIPLAVVAVVCLGFAAIRMRRRRTAGAEVVVRQADADAANLAERNAAAHVAKVLDPLGVASLDELARRRHRAQELMLKRDAARRAAQRRDEAQRGAAAAARSFDELAGELGLEPGTRTVRLAAAKVRESRRTARDGIDLRLEMLRVRRADKVGNDDEVVLERELAELLASGAAPASPEGLSPRAFEAQRADLERRCREAREEAGEIAGELRAAQAHVGDVASLDEEVGMLELEIARLAAFERAVSLARTSIDERTREAHDKFARRLEDYSAGAVLRVSDGRYADLRVDPTTLTIRMRVPETGAIHDVDRLSAGTREQAYLIVRLAMARMFAEGSEVLPLLLDDPFAFWDRDRIARGLPILRAVSAESQVVVFTASEALAAAAAAQGAQRIDLPGTAATA